MNRKFYFLLSFTYCLFFFLMRVLASPTLSSDEAEQYFYAQNFQLAYSSQAPLITWLLHPLYLINSLNFFSINLIKYFFYFIFLISFYSVVEKIINKDLRLSCFLSLVLCHLYSIKFHIDLIHTVLATALAALSLSIFFKLVENPKASNYIILGFVISLGILAKYNFIFLCFGILLALAFDKTHRKLLFKSPNIFYFILALIIPLALHIYGLFGNGFTSFAHASNKASLTQESFWNFEIQIRMFIKILQTALLPSICLIFFKIQYSKNLIGRIFIFSYGILIVSIYLLQIKNFSSHWIAPIAFLVPLFLFSNLQENKRTKVFNIFCTLLIIISIALHTVSTFRPEINNKSKAMHINFEKIYMHLNKLYDFNKTIFISNNIFILSNLKQAGKIKTLWLEKLSYDYYLKKHKRLEAIEEYKETIFKLEEKPVIILSKRDLNKKENLPKRFRKIFGNIKYSHSFRQKLKMHKKKNFKYYLWEA